MKSLKKTLVLLVVFSMILSTLVPAFAFDDVAGLDCEDQVTRMVALGIIEGFAEDGTFRPEETVTRAQMAVIIGKMVGLTAGQAEANANVNTKFSDVPAGKWYTGWVNLASNNGIISGYPDGTFRPDQTLTLNEVLTLCVKALGRGGYVDKMGTWPANYVTEAARLNLLKDVKTASVANRGNVAVIAWNTLNAATWYVGSETLDGEVSLGHDDRTLLAINFDEFTTEAGELKETEEDVLVSSTPARNINIGERQIVLANAYTTYGVDFDIETKTPKKSVKETKTYKSGNDIVAYVPEEVCADLDALYGREITVVFGEDNEVALIVVSSDSYEGSYVEEYNATDDEITIDGETFEFAVDADVFVNSVPTTMATVLSELGETSEEDFVKVVEASYILDEDGDISRLDLTVSGTYDAFNTREAVVTKNSSEVITYYYKNGNSWSKDTYDYEDELEDDKLPRVTIDGATGSIEDIEAGNVITMSYDEDTNDIVSIYVATETVTGEVTRLKNDGKRIAVDGTDYVASMNELFVTDDEIKDAEKGTWGTAVEKEDTVTLYVNVYGEYVVVATDDAGAGEWEFAYVRSIKDVDENDDEEYVATLRLLLADGTKTSAYTIVVDSDDWSGSFASFETYIKTNAAIVGEVIAFKANSDNQIVLDSNVDSDIAKDLLKVESVSKVGDYDVVTLAKNLTADDKRDTIGTYDFNSDTVIFDLYEEEILTKYSSIVSADKLVEEALAVVDDSDLKYMFFTTSPSAKSDELYAIYEDVDGDYVELFDGEEKSVEHDDIEATIDAIAKNAFVEYTTNSKDEVVTMDQLIDLDAFRNEKVSADMIQNGTKATLAISLPTVNEVKVDAEVAKGSYATGANAGLYGDAENKNAYLYIHKLEDVTNGATGEFTVVYDNPALAIAYPTTYATGTRTVEVTLPSNDTLDSYILLANGETSTVTVYAGHGSVSGKTPVAVHSFNNVKVAAVDTVAEETSKITVATVKEFFAVESTGKLRFTYADELEEEYGFETLGTVKVDEDAKVYDLRDGFVVGDFDDLVEAATSETIYVIPFKNSEAASGTANILVIVE